jgi:hypothetical protein
VTANFELAPPPKPVNRLLAVPIDIDSVDASLVFDGAAQRAWADATITYTVGPTAGSPIFDLRQEITRAWVDSVPLPVTQLDHHDFGTEPFTDLRVVQPMQGAGSVHTLRVQYDLARPNSQLGGNYPPEIEWTGPRLRFVFGLSDLNRARYAEAWLPANLLFDQYRISLDIELLGAATPHSVITNAVVTDLGTNHWKLDFQERSSAASPLLEIRPTDTLAWESDTVSLPVSGKTVTIEAWRPTSSTAHLTTELDRIKSFLIDIETDYGPYLHGSKFVAFFNGIGGGMEYDGGTTTVPEALLHETFHSWFARGVRPSSQADGWWDEGFTVFYVDGADDAVPFDFSATPVLLCSRDPWQRHTPRNAYQQGSTFWKGMVSLLGVGTLNALMADLYKTYMGNPASTQMIEEFLVRRGGHAQTVDAFHRFVYGLPDPSPAPDLRLDGGTDLWIRHADDGGTAHQAPQHGRDNWFHARVRNQAEAGDGRHFVVTFRTGGSVGTDFVYPDDFLPPTAAAAGFDLGPGDSRIVKALWPRALVPPAGSHTSLLAAVITRGAHPVVGVHVWDDVKLAQKDLAIG